MNKLQKKISISLLVISMLLISTFGALAADGPFTLVGELDISGVAPALVYKVGDQVFVLDPAAVCTNAAGLPMLCTALVDGAQVEVKGNSVGTVYTATSVAEFDQYQGELMAVDTVAKTLTVDAMVFTFVDATLWPDFYAVGDTVNVIFMVDGTDKLAYEVEFVAAGVDSEYTYEGPIVAFSDAEWTVGDYDFIVNPDTVLPPFYAVNDTVNVTFKMTVEGFLALDIAFVSSAPGNTYVYQGVIGATGAQWTIGDYDFIVDSATVLPEFYAVNDTVEVTFEMTADGYLALDITLIASDPASRYTYEGTLTAFDDTFWTVGDHIFNITELDLPIYFGVGDVVMLEFRMDGAAMDFYATDILNLVTYVPVKTESSRCDNVRDHPGVQKIADDVGADYEEIWNLFCKGFGLGEIKQAYRYAGEWANSDYTPEMLLALRAQGYSWGDLKKMAQGNIPPEGFGDGNGDDSEEIAAPGNNKNKEKDKDKGTPPGLENKLENQDEPTVVESTDGPGNSENAPGQLKDKEKDNNGKGKNK